MELPMKATPAELHLKQRVQQPEFEQVEFERFVFRVQSCEYSFFNAARQLFLHDGANNEIGHQVGELKARAILQRHRRVG